MRLQLRTATALASMLAMLVAGHARAEGEGGEVDIAATLFHEYGGPLSMTVVTPSARFAIDPVEELSIRGGWEADIVTGASVAVVDAPGGGEVDAITSATTLFDFRNVFNLSTELRSDFGRIRGGYAYGFENDYRSHGLTVGATAELFERNTTLDISYARGWDEVCSLFQPRAQEAVERRRLPGSDGCFGDPERRVALPVELDTFQGTWTQAWAPIFTTQLTLTAQLVNGFQSNPYRAVWLGRTAAQEHHPDHRARYAASLGARLWLEPLSAALQLSTRIYRDTWDVQSVSAELGYEQVIEGALRIRLRGRYYTQTSALFFSNDYALAPRGAYFTGDRELSAMSSVMVGGWLRYAITAGEEGSDLGFLRELDILLKADWIHSDFPEFRYGQRAVPNVDAIVLTLALEAVM